MKKEYLPCTDMNFKGKYPCDKCKTEKCLLAVCDTSQDVICEKCGEVVAKNIAPDNHNNYLSDHNCFNF